MKNTIKFQKRKTRFFHNRKFDCAQFIYVELLSYCLFENHVKRIDRLSFLRGTSTTLYCIRIKCFYGNIRVELVLRVFLCVLFEHEKLILSLFSFCSQRQQEFKTFRKKNFLIYILFLFTTFVFSHIEFRVVFKH